MHDEKIERSTDVVNDDIESGENSALSRQVLWKMDIKYVSVVKLVRLAGFKFVLISCRRILPVLALLFLCSFIDRTNVGNAKILGLQADTRMNDHQYAIGLCAFYATYIARYVFPPIS